MIQVFLMDGPVRAVQAQGPAAICIILNQGGMGKACLLKAQRLATGARAKFQGRKAFPHVGFL
jgi:hypothetical protein